jgi:hypothetical protein
VIRSPRIAGARYRGERHQRSGEPCCDALLLCPSAGFVICDGAGGTHAVARSAAAGARAAWRALLALQRNLDRQPRCDPALPVLQQRFHQAFLHHRPPAPLRDHTLLACLWSRRRLLVVQVGDSSLLLRRAGRWQLPLPPHKGECANETTFVRPTTPTAAIQLWHGPASDVEAVLAFSDGLEAAFLAPTPAAPERLQVNAALADLVVAEHQRRCGWRGYTAWLEASLADPALARLSDDDRTLVIATA